MSEGMVDTRSSSGGGKNDKRKRRGKSDSKKSQDKSGTSKGGESDHDGDDFDIDDIDWSEVLDGLLQDGSISVYLTMDENGLITPPPPPPPPRGNSRKRKGVSVDDNPALNTYDMEHRRFYNGLSTDKRAMIAKQERELLDAYGKEGRGVPNRFRLLDSSASPEVKSSVMARVEGLFRNDGHPSEKAKMGKWLESFLRLPLGVRRPMPVMHDSSREDIRKFVIETKRKLDDNIYGHADAKEQIIRTLAKWISNPTSRGTVIGLQGPPGCGKTTLVRNCIAQALNLPMVMIPLGGVTDSSVLTGHLYTYEGSTYGAVAGCLMNAKCMNPVILLDELDKVGGDSHRGQEVVNTLIHMTDPVQNENFVDHYFADIPIDLSRSLMVLTFNHLEAINPILRDRMSVIRTEGYVLEDKRNIAQKHLLPRIAAQHGLKGISITDDAVTEIVNRVETESGVRNLERAIDTIVGNINLTRMMSESEDVEGDVIDRDTVVKYITVKRDDDFSASHIYI